MDRRLLVPGFLFLASTAYAVDVTTCGQVVPAGQTGVLQTDLVCPTGAGVHLERRATLDLNGRSVAAAEGPAIACDARSCTIRSTAASPGDVSGSPDADCITMVPHGRMSLENVHVHDCRVCVDTNTHGVHNWGATIRATDVSVDGCAGPGINARRVKAARVSVTNANVIALWAEMALRGDDIDSSGNTGIGIFAVSIDATNVRANDNTWFGVESIRRMRIRGGEMTGNGYADVAAARVDFTDVTCGKSVTLGMGGATLGVCAND